LTLIRAAGGVLRSGDGRIAVVHRPRYDDWTLPKGKLSRGEHPLAAAVREVFEETGVRAAAGPRVLTVTYPVTVGTEVADKSVEYWAMTPLDAESAFKPNDEIDDLVWLHPEVALGELTWPHDREVVTAWRELPEVTATVIVVRHAHAGRRGAWPGPDATRPLDASGLAEAQALAPLFACYGPDRLASASPVRCVTTLSPLASTLDVPVAIDVGLDETTAPEVTARRLRAYAAQGGVSVLCSQGGVITAALAQVLDRPESTLATPKGTAWVLSFAGSRVLPPYHLRLADAA
jgi:8-oxo-dGTP diphosphatase